MYYAGPIVSQFNDSVPLYKGADKSKLKWNGLQVNRPIKVRRNPGIGTITDGGTLPTIGKQTTAQAVVQSRFSYLRFGMTGPMIKASQGDKGAFVSIMEFEMEQGMTDLTQDQNRQAFWNGSGKLGALASAAVATNTISVSGRSSGELGSKYLEVGMVVDLVNAAGTIQATAVTINSFTQGATSTVVLDTVVSADDAAIVVRSGSYNNEVQGLLTTLDGLTTEVYGINRATYPVFNGNVVDLNGAQLSLDSLQRTLNLARQAGGSSIAAIFTDYDSERYLNKLLVADKRYVGDKVKGDGSFTDKEKSYLEFGGAPVTPDKDCPGQNFFFMPAKGWSKDVLSEMEWADETGSYMISQSSADSFEVRLRLFYNFFPEKPSTMARLHDFISP